MYHKSHLMLILLSGFVIPISWAVQEDDSQPPPFTQADLIPKKDKQRPKLSDKPLAWYAPTALAGGLALNNFWSFKIKPACAFGVIGILSAAGGQYWLDKNKNLKTGLAGENEKRTQNFIIGAGLKSIGWVATALAVNGFVNYALKNPLFFGIVQSLDKFVITPNVFVKAPELAQFFQNNHLIAAGVAVLGVGLASNYFSSKSKTNLGYPHK